MGTLNAKIGRLIREETRRADYATMQATIMRAAILDIKTLDPDGWNLLTAHVKEKLLKAAQI